MDIMLSKAIGREEFDYPALTEALSGYANPRGRIGALLESGEVVRVKKGLYVFGEVLRRRPFSRELLANLIYGPSFVSLDYALSLHGLIPERVERLTSVTTGRARVFSTPVGVFEYRPAPLASFHLGMERIERGDVSFLMAAPERALADRVRDDRPASLSSAGNAAEYLFSDLRVDESRFAELSPEFLMELAAAFRSRKVFLCAEVLRNMRRKQ